MRSLVTLLVLLATGATPAADSTLSPARAEARIKKLATLAPRTKPGKPGRPTPRGPIAVSESEVNSYVNLTRGGEMPKGLSNVIVRFEHDRLKARCLLDLEQVRARAALPKALDQHLGFIKGKVPIEVMGRLRMIREGVGAFAIEDARLATLPVPVPVIEQLALWATTSAQYPKGVDIRSPFRLPFALKHVRIEPGRALLD